MEDSINREEKKKAVLAKLARKKKIGMDYIPVEKALSRIPSHARGDIQQILGELHKEGLLEFHKGHSCISINPRHIENVVQKLEDEVPDYILEKLER